MLAGGCGHSLYVTVAKSKYHSVEDIRTSFGEAWSLAKIFLQARDACIKTKLKDLVLRVLLQFHLPRGKRGSENGQLDCSRGIVTDVHIAISTLWEAPGFNILLLNYNTWFCDGRWIFYDKRIMPLNLLAMRWKNVRFGNSSSSLTRVV